MIKYECSNQQTANPFSLYSPFIYAMSTSKEISSIAIMIYLIILLSSLLTTLIASTCGNFYVSVNFRDLAVKLETINISEVYLTIRSLLKKRERKFPGGI